MKTGKASTLLFYLKSSQSFTEREFLLLTTKAQAPAILWRPNKGFLNIFKCAKHCFRPLDWQLPARGTNKSSETWAFSNTICEFRHILLSHQFPSQKKKQNKTHTQKPLILKLQRIVYQAASALQPRDPTQDASLREPHSVVIKCFNLRVLSHQVVPVQLSLELEGPTEVCKRSFRGWSFSA